MTILRIRCAAVAVTLTVAPALAPAAGDDALGRLFFSPEKRASLERQRHLNVRQAQLVEGDSLRVDGVVRRRNGPSTVWLNGQPVAQSGMSPDLRAALARGGRAGVEFAGEGDLRGPVKVGETLHTGTGDKDDGLNGGRILVRKPAR